jgi:acyl-coenzyme A thioesterase PaaI-like protein
MTTEQSIQDRDFADGNCFGCGPTNPAGLRIKSYPRADGTVVARWLPQAEHSNGAGAVCGGVLATILDCHCAVAEGKLTDAEAEP